MRSASAADRVTRPAVDPVHLAAGRARRRRPRGRTALGVLVAVGATAAAVTVLRPDAPPAVPPAAAPTGYGRGAGEPEAAAGYPTGGPGRFTAANGRSPVRGHDGPLRRYRVAVEEGSGQDVDAFAAAVDEVLGDPRSWIGSGELRVQRVPEAVGADFTVFLATPATSERMCAVGGLRTERYTSCRLPGQVIINLARWMEAVPDYGAPLETYRAYVVNHEVGHEFGERHQACPGPGEPAPVMQQQTYGLDGCVANAWPYVGGSRYEGAPTDGV
ncbi:DUF3152 domain-containing protein [Micromonospora sp. KC723]|nr:DUF3152 domain-containing protein [Micromonospora sp. KC723]